MSTAEINALKWIAAHAKIYVRGECRIIVGREPREGNESDLVWHLSISHPRRYPTWDEIKSARYEFIPDHVTVAMILPPESEYVNIHNNCFHLHEI